MELLEGVEHIEAVAVLVGDVGIGSDPEAAIDACAEMLGKLSVDLFLDHGALLGRLEIDQGLVGGHARNGAEGRESEGVK